MKFLTEDDLRVEYHQFPFETFTIKKEQRLTPGARTFLLDRKIKIVDENEVKLRGKLKPYVQKEEVSTSSGLLDTSWLSHPVWLDIRCEFLQTAYEVVGRDLPLAQELNALERYLATILAEGEAVLPPICRGRISTERVDRSFIHGNLSNVGMFLQSNNGQILVKLYPLYFHLEKVIDDLKLQKEEKFLALLYRLGQVIAHYLQIREEATNDATTVT
ncbi:hypothetical protein ACVR0P_06625 [Streptococcus castoreus]|uniref:hypothetical protein n=1 Tax=Streptococcus castoreus TaxID=254786 RepID=UPI0004110A8C|nr:hypothetical protein [Streptococcus castoreus]